MRSVFALLILAPTFVFAESPPEPDGGYPDCVQQLSLCGPDEVCFDAECIGPDRMCTDSARCQAGDYCDLRGANDFVPGVCRPTPHGCFTDHLCNHGTLCVAQPTVDPVCAPNDRPCAEARRAVCRRDFRLCTEDGDCFGERCVQGRCAAEDLLDAAANIMIDREQQARLERQRECDAGLCDSGCNIGPSGPLPWFGLILLSAASIHRRRGRRLRCNRYRG